MSVLNMQPGRALATCLLVAGAGSFLMAQSTIAVLINATNEWFTLASVKALDQTPIPVRAAVKDRTGQTVVSIPALDFSQVGKSDQLQLGGGQMLLLNAGDTKGATVKVSFKVLDWVSAMDPSARDSFLEYTACKPADSKQKSLSSLALSEGSPLAANFQLVAIPGKQIKVPAFAGKKYAFYELRERIADGGDAGDDPGQDEPVDGAPTEHKGPVPTPQKPGATGTEPVLSEPPLKLPIPGSMPAGIVLPPAAPAKDPTGRFTAVVNAYVRPKGNHTHAALPPMTAGENLWPAEAKTTVGALDTPVVLHTLTFEPGKVGEGEVFCGKAFVKTDGVRTGWAMLGIRFDCADGKSYFAGRMDSKVPTESSSPERVQLAIQGKAPANVVRITLSIQSRGFNPGAQATFDSVTFQRLGSASQ